MNLGDALLRACEKYHYCPIAPKMQPKRHMKTKKSKPLGWEFGKGTTGRLKF
jgi:hypothetical protein